MTDMPQCPGCHIGCNLANPNCGKGLGFALKFKAGEEIPERGGHGRPRPGADSGGPHGASPEMRRNHLAMLYTEIMPKVLGSMEGMKADDKTQILTWIKRMEGKMTKQVMGLRVQGIDTSALNGNLDELVADGLLTTTEIDGKTYYEITDAGCAVADKHEAAHRASVEKAFECLTDEGVSTLVELSHKIMDSIHPEDGFGARGLK